jgi:hypothetical protein
MSRNSLYAHTVQSRIALLIGPVFFSKIHLRELIFENAKKISAYSQPPQSDRDFDDQSPIKKKWAAPSLQSLPKLGLFDDSESR